MDIYQHDQSLRQEGYTVLAGLDEAGRGPIAGPVVAAAVILPEDIKINGLRDSKKVPEKERAILYNCVVNTSVDIGVGMAHHDEIDRINILEATRCAMQRALQNLKTPPSLLVIDALSLPSLRIKQISPTKAESKSASVAAASIVAKYIRDEMMLKYHEQYPQYNFRRHKGYCTEEHLNMIRKYGVCPIHRLTFNKVLNLDLPFKV